MELAIAIGQVCLIKLPGIEPVVRRPVNWPDNQVLRTVVTKPGLKWSPGRQAGWLKRRCPGNECKQVLHEAIKCSPFIRSRAVMKRELLEQLRSKPAIGNSGLAGKRGGGRGLGLNAVLIAVVSCIALLITLPAMAQRSLPTPGSTWGEIHFPGSALPEDSNNLILEGAVEQGVDIFPITKDTILNFFGSLDYSVDTEGFDWYRRLELGVGFKLRHYLSDTAIISVGAKYEIEKYFVDERTAHGFQLFSNWFSSWQLRNSDHHSGEPAHPLAFPGITWGELRYPGTQLPLDDDNIIFDGYVEQGVDWANWGRWGTFNFYANLDFITDTEDLPWNNSVAYGVGVKLKKLVGSNVLLQFGIEAVHERRWVSNQDNDVIFVYLNWSGWWDPRAIRLDLPE